jgi:hypothetical protein
MTGQLYDIHPAPKMLTRPLWQREAQSWKELTAGVGGNTDLDALTIKALYVLGIIRANCQAVTALMDAEILISAAFYPGYGVFASAVELLGRCIRGNNSDKGSSDDLVAGLQWLKAPTIKGYKQVQIADTLIQTSRNYSIEELTQLRHFSAHGQAVAGSAVQSFDYQILGKMPALLGDGIEGYLRELRANVGLKNNLVNARITPYRASPLINTWIFPLHDRNLFPAAVGDEFRQMDWKYKDKSPQLASSSTA